MKNAVIIIDNEIANVSRDVVAYFRARNYLIIGVCVKQ
jgi:hypothetical protein